MKLPKMGRDATHTVIYLDLEIMCIILTFWRLKLLLTYCSLANFVRVDVEMVAACFTCLSLIKVHIHGSLSNFVTLSSSYHKHLSLRYKHYYHLIAHGHVSTWRQTCSCPVTHRTWSKYYEFLIQERLISMTLDKDNEVALQTMKLLILISKWVFLSVCVFQSILHLLQQQLTSLSSDPLMMYWRLRTTNSSFSLFIHHSALLRPLRGSWSSQGIYMWTALSKNKSNKQNIWVFTECDQHMQSVSRKG